MMKISVLRSPAPGSVVFLSALILCNSGVLASTKSLHFGALEPLANAKIIDAEHLLKPSQSVIQWKIIDIQLASVCSYKRQFCSGDGYGKWEDKDYPGLNE
jgi:hypothetical protein